MLYACIKRIMDIVLAVVLLLLIWPLLCVIALLVLVFMGRPVFFRQDRPGLKGEVFKMMKFRTMRYAYDSSGRPLPDQQRMHPFGNLLRKTSLDELPELWNILTGKMSFIGPRPLLAEYLPYYSDEQARRHDVRPGLTGWAQVHGRNAQSWEDRLSMDVWYVDNMSLWLDLKIIVKTIGVLLTGRGVRAQGHVTMPRFDEYCEAKKK